ncbi:DNA methylase [Parabacteroides sp. AM08-6]|uniref:DNA methylase n=1 Tax=Parabacteroides sp. AM08-6 TaxID=2292053 RepID=UPI000EFEB5F8|nr:DNA methylase [Parabacteroides sp. AM08-6]RHJ76901.1 DNA methylase [Parabacteroides sp. AM08-6]
MDVSKLFQTKTIEILRSQIKFSDYNPRVIDEDGKKQLKRSLKNFGVAGGIVINGANGNTVVSGHQKIKILDEWAGYPANDYRLKVEVADYTQKKEKEANIAFNNPNIGGKWDFDALARIVPDIDWKDAGLTDADLNMIGVDYLLQTEEESSIADALSDMMSPVTEQKEAEKAAKQLERAEKVAHMKEVKQQVKESAQKTAEDMDAYVVLSFDTYEAKAAFMARFGYDPDMKFIKGELFDEMIERVD